MTFKINAATRLLAAIADRQQALKFLEELGFIGLKFFTEEEDVVKFKYERGSTKVLERHLGKPKSTTNGMLRYDFGVPGQHLGTVVVNTKAKRVVLRNSKYNNLKVKVDPQSKAPAIVVAPPTPPAVVFPEVPKVGLPPVPGSKDNDDEGVPAVHIDPALAKSYGYIQQHQQRQFMVPFMTKLWHYLNTNKFHGAMKEPKLGLLKNATSAFRMRGRAYWISSDRVLNISPRMFNGSQNYFVETMLHEMCHQAVSEIDHVEDNTNGGHGSHWTHWMRKVGLNPLRYDPNSRDTYMSPKEKAEREDYLTTRVPLAWEDLRCGTKATTIGDVSKQQYIGIFMGEAPQGWLFYYLPKVVTAKTKFFWVTRNTIANYSRFADPQGKLNNPKYRAKFQLIMLSLYKMNHPDKGNPNLEELSEYIKSISRKPNEGQS